MPTPVQSLRIIEWAAIAGLALLTLSYVTLAGHLSRHMILHIALMNGVAPLLAARLIRHYPQPRTQHHWYLLIAATAQLILFFTWHSPPVMAFAMHNTVIAVVMQLSLLFAAVWFWTCVLSCGAGNLWPPIIALLLTGKLYCLFAVLLIFAPRTLYVTASHGNSLADQQLAGLLMITACPIIYILAAVVLVARWLQYLREQKALLVGHG